MKRDEESAVERKGRKSTLILNRSGPKKQPLPGFVPDACRENPGRGLPETGPGRGPEGGMTLRTASGSGVRGRRGGLGRLGSQGEDLLLSFLPARGWRRLLAGRAVLPPAHRDGDSLEFGDGIVFRVGDPDVAGAVDGDSARTRELVGPPPERPRRSGCSRRTRPEEARRRPPRK